MRRVAGSGSSGGRSKFARLIKLPIRALCRARDYYVHRMVDCGQVSRFPGAHGVGLGLQRSFSVAGSAAPEDHRSEDFRELVRAASVRTLAAAGGVARAGRVARSASASVGVGMGRIDEKGFEGDDGDEDETMRLRFDAGENGGGGRKQSVVFWRSNSYAVTTKSIAF